MKIEFKGAQKRIYIPEAAYFITVKTHNNGPFFKEKIFYDLFVENLRVCKKLKEFSLYGWVIVHDLPARSQSFASAKAGHIHLLIQPRGKWSYSEIMFSIKKQFSHDANRVMGFNPPFPVEGAQTFARLQRWVLIDHQKKVSQFRKLFLKKYGNHDPFDIFRWQKSFHDHYIRNVSDFETHMKYIIDNLYHHPLPKDWPYIFTNEKFADLAEEDPIGA